MCTCTRAKCVHPSHCWGLNGKDNWQLSVEQGSALWQQLPLSKERHASAPDLRTQQPVAWMSPSWAQVCGYRGKQNMGSRRPSHKACSSVGWACATARHTPLSHFAMTTASWERRVGWNVWFPQTFQNRWGPNSPIQMFLCQRWILPRLHQVFPKVSKMQRESWY